MSVCFMSQRRWATESANLTLLRTCNAHYRSRALLCRLNCAPSISTCEYHHSDGHYTVVELSIRNFSTEAMPNILLISLQILWIAESNNELASK